MPAFVIADVDVTNPGAYEQYRSQVQGTLQPYGGRFRVRGGHAQVLEGDWQPSRLVIIEFPSLDQAQQWYNCAAYQAILPLRLQNADSRVLLMEGVE